MHLQLHQVDSLLKIWANDLSKSPLTVFRFLNTYFIKNELVITSAINVIEIWDSTSYEKAINNPEINFNWQRNNINYPDWEKEWQRGWPGHHNKPSNTIDCDQTQFYCCPDNVTAKENEEGTNCPSYVKPEPEPDSTIDSENFWVL